MNFSVITPKTKSELLKTIRLWRSKKFRLGAGCTDLLMELRNNQEEDLTVINLSQVKDVQFTDIKKSAKGLRLGAMLTAHKIVMSKEIKSNFPVLHEASLNLASTQIRQVATVGGNLCTASPSGDIACALVALEADCEILETTGKTRTVPITEFFTGVRKTALKKNEVLYEILIPKPLSVYPASWRRDRKALPFGKGWDGLIYSHFIKIGTRRSMECSVVSLAYHIQTDKSGKIIHAGVAIGASAPTIRFAKSACDFLIGKKFKNISEKEREEFAKKVLSYSSPITDIRATAWYRKEVLFNISKAIFE